jgi:proteasome accessory factor B
MAADKSERLLKLLIMLLVQRRYVAKDKIRAILYPDTGDEAFERMFERDKDDLRALGVPIEVGAMDAYFDDEPGYRVRPDDLRLPEVSLTPDESAVVGLATKVWEHARLAEATTDAVRKLTAAGVDGGPSARDKVETPLGVEEPAFDVFWEAARDRQAVTFDYRRAGAVDPVTRHLQPWGVVRYSGRWYAVGLDTDRGEERVFRLSRVVGQAKVTGRTDAYDVPAGVDLREVTRRLDPGPSPAGDAGVVLVRSGSGHGLRRDGELVEVGVTGPDGRSDWDRLRLARGGAELTGELLSYGADVFVEEPATLRDELVSRLREAVGAEA